MSSVRRQYDVSNPAFIMDVAKTLVQPFTVARLAVACWEKDRLRFGLEGYELQYPDNNKVATYLYGRMSIVGLDGLRKVGSKLYAFLPATTTVRPIEVVGKDVCDGP